MTTAVPSPMGQNAAINARLRARRRRTLFLLLFCLLMMPLGCTVPWTLIAWLPDGAPKTVAGITGLVLPLVALVGFILMISDSFRWKRALRTAEQAERMGYVYTDKPQKADYAILRETHMFGEADSELCSHLLSGDMKGQAVLIADYSAVYGYGKNAKVYSQTIILLPDAASAAPNLLIYPKGWLNAFEKLLGEQQFDFRDDPKFDRAFIVKGGDEQEVRNAVTPAVRALCLADPKLTVEVFAGRLFVTRLKNIQPSDKYPDLVAEAFRFAAALQPPMEKQ